MSPAKPLLLTISLLSALPWCTVASDGKPLVTAITKDASTSLCTVPIKDTHPLVLDLSGPLIWSTCDASPHPTVQLYERDCMEANRYTPPGCWTYTDQDEPYPGNKCTAHPYNPFTGECASGDLTRTTLSANATDGKNPLYPVSFSAVASCAPDSLLASLPAGAVGVAGLGRSELALPAQVASAQNVSRKFALCLPSGGQGVAIFGGGPVFLLPPWLQEITSIMGSAPQIPRIPRVLHLDQGHQREPTASATQRPRATRRRFRLADPVHGAPARRVPPVRAGLRQRHVRHTARHPADYVQ